MPVRISKVKSKVVKVAFKDDIAFDETCKTSGGRLTKY